MRAALREIARVEPGDVGLPRLDRDRGAVGGRAEGVSSRDLQQIGVSIVQHPVLRPGQPWGEPATHRPGAAAEVVDHQPAGCREGAARGSRRGRVHGPRSQRAREGQASAG